MSFIASTSSRGASKRLPGAFGAFVAFALLAAYAVYRLTLPEVRSSWFTNLFKWPTDFKVYYNAAVALNSGQELYSQPFVGGLPFTYPPFSGVIFRVLPLARFEVAASIWLGLTALVLFAVIIGVFRERGYAWSPGLVLVSLAVYDQNISALMQTGGLLHELTVKDTVEMIAAAFPEHLPLEEVIEQANLEPIYKRRVGKCSGGEQQRLRFALAILGNPDILILDEPTAGMDAGARHRFWDSMKHQAQLGRTIIFATHYLEEADNFAQRIVLMHEGEIVADGTTDELRNMSANRVVSAEFPGGFPELSSLRGVIKSEVNGRRLRITTNDSDALARYLLTETDARDLDITSHSLEDTFLALTNENQEA